MATTPPANGHEPGEPVVVSRQARRLVGLERNYHCDCCDSDRRSWSRMAACPDCGNAYVAAVIRRAAVATA